jgi:hypothetical protein
MPEARQFAGLVHIARDSDEFVRLVEGVLADGDGDSAARMAEARNHTWRKRFADVSTALADVLAASAG